MIPDDEPVQVECYAGGRGEETPRRLRTESGWADLAVLDRWVSEAAEGGVRRRWFRVRVEGRGEGLVYYDEGSSAWFYRIKAT